MKVGWRTADMSRSIFNTVLVALAVLASLPSYAVNPKQGSKPKPQRQEVPVVKDQDGVAEARLIEIYRLIGSAQNREALAKADKLVEDFPHF